MDLIAAPSFLKAKQGVRPRLMVSEQFVLAEGSGEDRSGSSPQQGRKSSASLPAGP